MLHVRSGLYMASLPSEPEDHVRQLAKSAENDKGKQRASYGVDSPMGFALSFPFNPMYAYATYKGKFDFWDNVISNLPESALQGPALDAGCGRGLVLIKLAKAKKVLASQRQLNVAPAYGIDIFNTMDQSGNAPKATFHNIQAENVVDYAVLHTASFTALPFSDNSFSLITSSLALHNPADVGDRQRAVRELARVLQPGGVIVLLDLSGQRTTKLYATELEKLGWTSTTREFAGMGTVFGAWPSQVVRATKP